MDTNSFATDVLASLPTDHIPATYQCSHVNVTVRRKSTRANRQTRRGHTELTGGIEVTATTSKRYSHRSGLPVKRTRSLRPEWTDAQLHQAIVRCVEDIVNSGIVNDARELAYKAVESHIIPDEDMLEACERFGNEGDYTTFDRHTCQQVIEWANTYPIKLSSM